MEPKQIAVESGLSETQVHEVVAVSAAHRRTTKVAIATERRQYRGSARGYACYPLADSTRILLRTRDTVVFQSRSPPWSYGDARRRRPLPRAPGSQTGPTRPQSASAPCATCTCVVDLELMGQC